MKTKVLILCGITVLLLSAGCSAQSKAVNTGSEISSPDAVVENFYSDYLNYFEDPETGDFRDPLSDRIYANRSYVTQDLIDEIDSTVASFSAGGAYDPIICGQNVPDYITFNYPIVSSGMVTFMIETSFEDHHFFVHLEKESDGWKIDTISCDF